MTCRLVACVFLLALLTPSAPSTQSPMTVHEWGTFTSVAGEHGEAVQWLPQSGVADLPCFVDRLVSNPTGLLSGTVRMETPVIYFYAPQPATVEVRVRFPQGTITEWCPPAAVTPASGGTIAWHRVVVAPDASQDFPIEPGPSHYYAARETEASPVAVGSARERFLFYRGVGRFTPVAAPVVTKDGSILLENLANDAIGDALLFDNHGGDIATGRRHVIRRRAVFDAPLPADRSPIEGELAQILVDSGLYPAEAAAMLATWGDSWFEEGTRIFYIVPRSAVDATLPLDISPTPASIVRVFVGRVELISPATRNAVKAALLARDRGVLEKYGRFLQPIGARLVAESGASERLGLETALKEMSDKWNVPASGCRQTTNH